MINESLGLISMGFALGLVHALDADHVMAVSMLNNSKPSLIKTLKFCCNWALGHGGILMLSGLLLFGFGLGVPGFIASIAEILVGVFLIIMGLLCIWRFRSERIQLSEHSHGDVVHRHWHVKSDVAHSQAEVKIEDGELASKTNKKSHAPVLVGIMHGFAGSAPALALIPMVAQGDVFVAMLYLLLFSLGVVLSMLVFGLGFGVSQRFLQKRYLNLFGYFRHLLAIGSIIFGGVWISQAL